MDKREKLKSTEIEKAVAILRSGGIVIFPTDTVYGIGCRWDNLLAIHRIKNIKRSQQEFPVLVSKVEQIYPVAKVTPFAVKLAHKYWPGALTMILKSNSDAKKIGFRQPDSDVIRLIIDKLGVPIVGTSANFHGQKAATSYEELDPQLIKKADLTVYGTCKLKQESTVIDLTLTPAKILRRGAAKLI